MLITSAHNNRVKLVNRLRSKRGRRQEARFVIDYERDLQRALRFGYQIDFVLYCADHCLPPDFGDIETHPVAPSLLKRVSYRENPDGIVAVMYSKPAKEAAQLEAAQINHAIVLVDLQVPGNIGALLRTADSAGIDAVILVDSALDLYNPNIIRSSTGACFLDNIYQLSGEEALVFLKRDGFQIVAADVAAERSLFEMDFRTTSAIVLGTEESGLTETWISSADEVARIPMNGVASDSLNVSVSGALFIYELVRQRHICQVRRAKKG